jgi:hypothetical protein
MDTSVTAARSAVAEGASAVESFSSAVSWPAILAGAVVAASVSLILLALGSGLGFASVSPWPERGASATTFTVITAMWLIVVQWVASGLGGYLTGRLRTKWTRAHTHEVFFRDTAHGFVTWGLATVISAIVLASAASAAIGAGAEAASNVAGGAAQAAASTAANVVSPYQIDTLFRSTQRDASSAGNDGREEAGRILAQAATTGELSAADRGYLAQLIASRTGVSQSDAEQRVDAAVAQIKAAEVKVRQAADAARKAAAAASLYTALSMLIGAFIASAAAALGGRQRDEQLSPAL